MVESPMRIAPFKLERYFAKYEFTARHLLCCSDCESLSVQDLLSLEPGAGEAFQKHWLGYTESPGSSSLRREICRLYGTIKPDEVLVHSGAEEAIFLFMHAVLEAGDHLIVHSPCYQSLSEIARSIGCEVTRWQADERRGWALDPAELKNVIRANTKVIVLNTPHNPTGYLMESGDFKEVNRIAQERCITLFSDEVYRESEYNLADRLPPACDVNETAVSVGVMSKTYGLPGLRIGWVATRNAKLLSRMAELKDYTTICSSAPSEFLAEVALRHRERIAQRNLRIIGENLTVLDDFFSRHRKQFEWIRPKAGAIAFPCLLAGDAASFCHELVTRSGVLLLPGSMFDDSGNHFRIGFGRKNMPRAVASLEEFLNRARG
jgi:aspartate/methionine/tyrosine aminotransferase